MKFQAQRPLTSILLLTFAGLSLICLNTTVLAQADEPPADTAPEQDTASENEDTSTESAPEPDTVSPGEQQTMVVLSKGENGAPLGHPPQLIPLEGHSSPPRASAAPSLTTGRNSRACGAITVLFR